MNSTTENKRLTRSRDDRFIGGVAAGVARHLNIDPVIVRIGFVLSIIFGGIGVARLPDPPRGRADRRRPERARTAARRRQAPLGDRRHRRDGRPRPGLDRHRRRRLRRLDVRLRPGLLVRRPDLGTRDRRRGLADRRVEGRRRGCREEGRCAGEEEAGPVIDRAGDGRTVPDPERSVLTPGPRWRRRDRRSPDGCPRRRGTDDREPAHGRDQGHVRRRRTPATTAARPPSGGS